MVISKEEILNYLQQKEDNYIDINDLIEFFKNSNTKSKLEIELSVELNKLFLKESKDILTKDITVDNFHSLDKSIIFDVSIDVIEDKILIYTPNGNEIDEDLDCYVDFNEYNQTINKFNQIYNLELQESPYYWSK